MELKHPTAWLVQTLVFSLVLFRGVSEPTLGFCWLLAFVGNSSVNRKVCIYYC